MTKNLTLLKQPQELFRIKTARGKYIDGDRETKNGKVWVNRAHLHQHLGQYSHACERANNYQHNPNKWTVFPKQIPFFQQRYGGGILINETTGATEDALEYVDRYYRTAYGKDKRK